MSDEAKFNPRAALDPSRALVPAVIQVNEVRVAEGFWPKFRKVATKIPFAKDLLAVWFSARDDDTPLRAKGLMFAGLAYFVLPTDALPDIITGIGFTDDAAVLFALMNVVGKNVKAKHRDAAKDLLNRMGGQASRP
jgi:uncharacterized membrane protein YkvA (DUF1232 family)